MFGSNSTFFIPEGREVKLLIGEKNVFDVLGVPDPTNTHLIYDDEISLNIKSDYENLIDVGSNKLLNIASAITDGFVPSGQFAVQGMQIWKSTDVIEFSLNVEMHMINSGKNQVVLPSLALAKLCVPSKKNSGLGAGQSLIPPGPNLNDILRMIGSSITIKSGGDEANGNIQGGGLLHVRIGKFLSIDNVVLTKVEPTYSKILDDEYMPISCKMSLDFRTVEVANTEMLQSMMDFAKGGV